MKKIVGISNDIINAAFNHMHDMSTEEFFESLKKFTPDSADIFAVNMLNEFLSEEISNHSYNVSSCDEYSVFFGDSNMLMKLSEIEERTKYQIPVDTSGNRALIDVEDYPNEFVMAA